MSRFAYCYAECRYAGCRNTECRYAECRVAKNSWILITTNAATQIITVIVI
jgi:hypothetical protein